MPVSLRLVQCFSASAYEVRGQLPTSASSSGAGSKKGTRQEELFWVLEYLSCPEALSSGLLELVSQSQPLAEIFRAKQR